VPLREALGHTELRIGSVLDGDPDRNVVRVESIEGSAEELRYDQLIVALGSISRTLPCPASPSTASASSRCPTPIELRNRLLRTLEAAETLEDPPSARRG
jgi:NADH dehydrogenase